MNLFRMMNEKLQGTLDIVWLHSFSRQKLREYNLLVGQLKNY